MISRQLTYLDWAATAPLCDEAAEAMMPYFEGGLGNLEYGGNANSLHSIGRHAFAAMENARTRLARCAGCRPDELFFTSGATESDNTIVFGVVESARAARRMKGDSSFEPHVITSAIEHEAVLEPMHRLERQGVRVTYLPSDANGFVSPDALDEAMGDDTVLVSIMAANNEVGSIQPIEQLARISHEHGAFFHTDAVQAFGKIPFDCTRLGVDAASFSAHKICGPKGIGALYLSRKCACKPFMLGGGQEAGLRSGTQNVAGMAGFAAAAESLCDVPFLAEERMRLEGLRDRLYRFLSSFDGVAPSVACSPKSHDYLPNIIHVTVADMESETMILRMDRERICVSGGSACSSKSLGPNRILSQLGMDKDRALGALRLSLGRYSTLEDVECFESAFQRMIDWARS